MRHRLNPLVAAAFCYFTLLCTRLNVAAQDFSLPAPMRTIPVEKLDFDPDATNSCISVEGPEILRDNQGNNTSEILPDAFTSCGLKLFAPLLDPRFRDGTQQTTDAIDALARCSNSSSTPKHLILIGHGSPGSIATGNGTNPQSGQNIDSGTTEAIEKLRLLTGSDLVLFGCETGATDVAVQLLNQITKDKFTSRARNGQVMCSLDEAHNGAQKGLYVFKGTDQLWTTARPNALLARSNAVAQPVDLDPDSCFALKGPDGQFNVMSKNQFSSKKQHRKISPFDLQSESALGKQLNSEFDILSPPAFTQDGFHRFLAGDSDLLESIGFCQVLGPDLVPDAKIVGTFTLKIDGNLRQFYELSGGLVQDSEHKEVYYRAKPNSVTRLHQRVLQENERLLRLHPDKLQKHEQMK